jgi:CDP-diacylglycerol---glycerol-3-phosphate 3-phosphatidyltransferase
LISAKAGHRLDPVLIRFYNTVLRKKPVDPNLVTALGLFFALAASVLLGLGYRFTAGVFLLISGFFDLLDGAVARSSERVTRFGGFFDSVLDRYSDLSVMAGLTVYFLQRGDLYYVLISLFASLGVAIIPYARARAEAASIPCNTGLLERPERTIILLIGLFFNLLRPTAIVLAILTHVTVVQRILFVKKRGAG